MHFLPPSSRSLLAEAEGLLAMHFLGGAINKQYVQEKTVAGGGNTTSDSATDPNNLRKIA